MKDKKQRNSNLEVLRIICMLLIVAHHFSVHGNFQIIGGHNISVNSVIIQVLSLWGKMACNIFIIITGYFMIKSKFSLKKFILLILEMYFYAIGIMIVISIFDIEEISVNKIIKSCLTIFYGNWFLINYLIIYCLVPFLNKMIIQFDEKTLKNMLFILIMIFCIIPTFALNSKFEFNNIDIMIIMYIVGAYIRLYVKHENKKYVFEMFLLNFILIFSVMGFDFFGTILNRDNLIRNATYFSKINSIIVVLGAITTFLYFLRKSNYSSNIINFISSSTLGVYLIHDNDYIRKYIWEIIFPNNNFIDERYFIIFAITKIFITFVICVIIDKIRYYIFEKNISKLIDKFETKFV